MNGRKKGEEDKNWCRKIKNSQLSFAERRNIGEKKICEGKWRVWRTKHSIVFSSSSYILVSLFSKPVLRQMFSHVQVKWWGQHIYSQNYLGISRVCYYSTSTVLQSPDAHPFSILTHLTFIEILICVKNSAWHLQLKYGSKHSANQPETSNCNAGWLMLNNRSLFGLCDVANMLVVILFLNCEVRGLMCLMCFFKDWIMFLQR